MNGMKDNSERIEQPPKQNVQRRQYRKTAGAGPAAGAFFTNYKLVYTNETAILYQTKRSQPTRRRRGGRRRPGPGGTAGHQQPPAPPSASAPPTEGGPCSGPAVTRVRDWCHFSVGQFIPDSGHRPHTSPTDDHRITVRGQLSPGTRQTPQPPAEESGVPPPGRGPEAAHDESAAPPSRDTAASTGRCRAPLRSTMTASARPSPTAAPAAAASGDATRTGAGPGGAASVPPASGCGGAARTAGRHRRPRPPGGDGWQGGRCWGGGECRAGEGRRAGGGCQDLPWSNAALM